MPDDAATEVAEVAPEEFIAELQSDIEKGSDETPAVEEAPAEEPESEEETAPEEEIPGEGDAEDEDAGEGEEEEADADLEPEGISRELLHEAAQVGLSVAEADEFGSDSALRAHLRLSAKKAETQKGAEETSASSKGWELPEIENFEIKEVSDEDYDEADFGKNLSGINNHYKAQMETMRTAAAEKMGTLYGMIRDLTGAVQDEQFISAADRLGDEWTGVLGKRGARNDGHWDSLGKVITAAESLQRMAAEKGARVPSMDEAMAQAATMTFPKETNKQTLRKAAKKASARKGNQMRKAGAAKTGVLSEEEKEVAMIADIGSMARQVKEAGG